MADLFRNVVSLSVKLKEATVPDEIANPRQLAELAPRELSFWVASLFAGNPYQVRTAALGPCLGFPGYAQLAIGTGQQAAAWAAVHARFGSKPWRQSPPGLTPCSNKRCWRRRRRWAGSRWSRSC